MKKLFALLIIAVIIFMFTPQSVKLLQGFISSHGSSSWAPTAQYQLGNFCFWTLKYSQGLGCYQTYLTTYPGDPGKSAASMFRTAVCFERTKNYIASIEAYDRFVQAYPSHKEAGRARTQLDKLRAMHQ